MVPGGFFMGSACAAGLDFLKRKNTLSFVLAELLVERQGQGAILKNAFPVLRGMRRTQAW
jgi:hypothetical protein